MKKQILILIILIPLFTFSQSSYKRNLCESVLKAVFEEKYDTPKFSIYSKDDVLVISCNYQITVSSSELAQKTDAIALMLYSTKQNNFKYFQDFSSRNIFNDILNEYKFIFFRTNYITSNLETLPVYYLLSLDEYNILKQNLTEKSFIEILHFIENK
jgi:hypothetical protein